MRWIQDTAAHHIMPPRLKHEALAYPVIFPEKMQSFFHHILSFQYWAATGYHSDRIAAGVGIYTKESFSFHHFTASLV
jgi:hypothetical protein